MKKNSILACISILLLIGLDQFVKFLITSHMALYDTIPVIKQVFHITYIQNKGAAWGLFQNSTWILGCFSLLILGVIFYAYFKLSYEKRFLFLRIIFCMLAAGALGNCIDRFWHH